MNTNIYVGNLPWSVSSEELEQLFQEYGDVRSAKVISDRETGRSRGFGFVEMASGEESSAAISSLDGKEFQGRTLVVNEARARKERGGGGRGGYGGGGGRGGYGGGGGGWGGGGGGRGGYGNDGW